MSRQLRGSQRDSQGTGSLSGCGRSPPFPQREDNGKQCVVGSAPCPSAEATKAVATLAGCPNSTFPQKRMALLCKKRVARVPARPPTLPDGQAVWKLLPSRDPPKLGVPNIAAPLTQASSVVCSPAQRSLPGRARQRHPAHFPSVRKRPAGLHFILYAMPVRPTQATSRLRRQRRQATMPRVFPLEDTAFIFVERKAHANDRKIVDVSDAATSRPYL